MQTNKAIQKVDNQLAPDKEWRDIVDSLVDGLDRGDLPEQVVKATELLLAGWPSYKAAKEIGVPAATLRGWLEKYPVMALTVAEGRKLLSKWRMSKLEQQFVTAIEKSEEVLELDLEDRAVNSKLVGVVAQHARFIIGLFAGQKIDVNVTVDIGEQTLKARQDALDYLAESMTREREDGAPIEGSYRIVAANENVADNRPLLDEEGNPAFGEIGVLGTTEEGTLCHVCGQRSKTLDMHIAMGHQMKLKEYELCFMLELGSIKRLNANG